MSIKERISKAARKIKGDTSANHTDAQLASDSPKSTELPESGLYTVAETAARLGLNEAALYKRIQRDQAPVPPIRMSKGAIRFSKAMVEQFVAGDARID